MQRSAVTASRLLVLALLCATLGACAGDTGGSGGACAGPVLLADDDVVTPGAELVIRGENFIDGCVDSAANGTPVGTQSPYGSVEIVVTQEQEVILAQEALPDGEGAFEVTLTVPADLGSDPIEIGAPDIVGAEPLTLTVTTG